MMRLVLSLNSLLFDHDRGTDRVAAALLVVAALAGISRSGEGFVTCLGMAILMLTARARRRI
ncbi:MAG TPA: hypothetical protein VGQ44_15325 [Gemmatimonadaceae bacterium]|jgi:hypothetical protein|nr:hypothetical protein [Gemmatimonadaceae bacterium]